MMASKSKPKSYSCVILKKSKTVLVLKSNWCLKKVTPLMLNKGLPPHKLTKIYYSPRAKDAADFQQKCRKEPFDDRISGCYRGFILKSGSK